MMRHRSSTAARLAPRRVRPAHLFIFGALAGLLVTGVQPTRADQYTDNIAKDQRTEAQNDSLVASWQAQIAAAKDKEAALKTVIANLQSQMVTTQAQIDSTTAQLAAVNAHLVATQANLAATRVMLATQKNRLAVEVVIIYETENQATPLANLVTSGDFNSFWRQVIDDHRIGQIEDSTVTQIHQEEDAVQAEVSTISADQQQKQLALATLNDAQQALGNEMQARQAAVDYLNQLQAQDQALIAQVIAANNALNAQIAQLQSEEQAALAAGGGSGRFMWPDEGPISQGFGCTSYDREPPASYYGVSCPSSEPYYHSGIDIAGPCGHTIVAADSGIAYVEPWYPNGYGNYVIIVHGNGWETLYGHMSGFAIGDGGQRVTRGQTIGYEGSTGNSSGCHLHFGVSHNNTWVNPLNYLS